MTLADQIRMKIAKQVEHVRAHDALLAVLNECEWMRQLSGATTAVRTTDADRIEAIIARELGINPEETS